MANDHFLMVLRNRIQRIKYNNIVQKLTLLNDGKIGNKYGITSPGTGPVAKVLGGQSERETLVRIRF